MSFAENLRRLLDDRGMKAVELARKADLSESIISEYLSGKKEPRGRQSVAIAKALDVPMDTLWGTEFQEQAEAEYELNAYLEELRTRPEMCMLFKTFKGATKEEVEQVVKMIEQFKKTSGR